MKALAATHFFDIASRQNIGITLMVFPLDDLDVMTILPPSANSAADRWIM